MLENIIDKDPANDGDLTGTLKTILRKELMNVEGMLPARVISYDRAKNLAMVQPFISVLTTSGKSIERAPIASIPVLCLGGGGFIINFPLVKDDTGWIEASDRDISIYLQEGKISKPNSKRIHSFSDGRFIPDIMGKYTIDQEDNNSLVIQTYDGKTKITLTKDGKIKSKGSLEHQGDVSINGNLTVTDKMVVTGDSQLKGTLSVDKDANIKGDATINKIRFGKHVHQGVRTGEQSTRGPSELPL